MKKQPESYITVRDHSVTNESFELFQNEIFGYLETRPKPNVSDLPNYYKSDDYISHTNTKRNLFEKVYHFVRSIALKRKLKLINAFDTEGKQILDFGCGTGDFLKVCKNDGWQITGVEPNEKARSIAKENTNATIYSTDDLNLLQNNSFDVITLWHVLEHLPDLENHINLIKRLLKPNGKLVLALPNYKSYDAAFYKKYWAAYDVPRHLWHFSKESIPKLFSGFGFKLESTLPLKFDSFYVSLLSEKYKTGFMNPIRAFVIGLTSNIKARRTKEYSSIIYILHLT